MCYSRELEVVRFFFFFFNDTATTEIYTLSLHDALPISIMQGECRRGFVPIAGLHHAARDRAAGFCVFKDRKSTRLNSSHLVISYAVFCLKKKKNNDEMTFCLRMSLSSRQRYRW